MKRLILFFIITILFSYFSVADENIAIIYEGPALTYNDYSQNFDNSTIAITYNSSDNSFYFCTKTFTTAIMIKLDNAALDKLRANIAKFIEWEKIATDKEVEIDKELPDSKIHTGVIWYLAETWYSNMEIDLSFRAFSQNTKRHQFVISSNKVISDQNKFITFSLENTYFDKDQAVSLLNAIDKETIAKQIADHDEKLKTQELFK